MNTKINKKIKEIEEPMDFSISIDEANYVLTELMERMEILKISSVNYPPLYIAGAQWGAIQAIDILKKKKKKKENKSEHKS